MTGASPCTSMQSTLSRAKGQFLRYAYGPEVDGVPYQVDGDLEAVKRRLEATSA
jgi:hypothetical protein